MRNKIDNFMTKILRMKETLLPHPSSLIPHPSKSVPCSPFPVPSPSGFTLIELLVVIAIMGLLGTISVGGYRAMQRGMEERGVMQNANTFVKAAFERAQIDRQPTAIYYWNETLRSSTMDQNEIVVGRAVAIRMSGRLSMVSGELLLDEFSDLNLAYATDEAGDSDQDSGGDGGSDAGENTMLLYCLDNLNEIKRSVVYSRVSSKTVNEVYLGGTPSDSAGSGKMDIWGFKIKDRNGATWKTGSAYGMEFAEITLPHGYIFGSDYSTSVENPVKGEKSMAFGVGKVSLDGVQSVKIYGSMMTIYSLRPDGSGGLKAEKVDTVEKPK